MTTDKDYRQLSPGTVVRMNYAGGSLPPEALQVLYSNKQYVVCETSDGERHSFFYDGVHVMGYGYLGLV